MHVLCKNTQAPIDCIQLQLGCCLHIPILDHIIGTVSFGTKYLHACNLANNKQKYLKLFIPSLTLENHCTRTAQSSRGGHTRRVHKTEYIAIKKRNVSVNILLLKIFVANYCHL